ncbi:MAG: MBL fold metallo-hydrolase [Pseudomonadota bacterium]|nr:MBL fold metallo-hydrolase [Pseudomonadota bacterium]
MRALLLVLLAGALCCRADAAADWVASTAPMALVKVAPHTWYVRGEAGMVSAANQGFNSNAGFVVTRDGVVVFDALGTPGLGAALLARIRTVTRAPIRKIVISHYHSDHFYGLTAFKAAGPVEVIAQRAVRDYLATPAAAERLAERRHSLAPWVDARTAIVAPDRYLDDAASSFQLGGMTFTILHAGPAHTPEDLMMLVKEEGVLFAGDVVFTGRIPFVGDADITPWLGAIERLAAARPKVMVTGHGAHSTDAGADLALTRDYLSFLRTSMRAAVEQGTDFEDAYRATDWSAFGALPAFEAANHKNAFGAYLAAEREALKPAAKP